MKAYRYTHNEEIIETFNLDAIKELGLDYETIEIEEAVQENIFDYKDLLIYNQIKSNVTSIEEIVQIDFTLLGLTTETPKYAAKGVKQKAEYTFEGKIVVSKIFEYVANGLKITINYHLENGAVGYFKQEFKPLDIVEIAKINKANRDRSITFLQASSIGTPIEAHVNTLLKRYKTEVDLYIQNGTKDFENVVNAEAKPPFLNYLNILLQPNLTVKQAIIKQIAQ